MKSIALFGVAILAVMLTGCSREDAPLTVADAERTATTEAAPETNRAPESDTDQGQLPGDYPGQEMDSELASLSALFQASTAPGKLDKAVQQEILDGFRALLPAQEVIGPTREWRMQYNDGDDEDIIFLTLADKDSGPIDKLFWFHILYRAEKPERYGSEDFGAYRGMGAKGAHYFIQVGRMEIRAVADADEFKDDVKIKEMLRAFRLDDIARL